MSDVADLKKLENLGGLVGEVDAESGPTEEQAEKAAAEAAAQTEAQAWAQVPLALGSALMIVAPELQAIYTKEACEAWGAAMVPVAEKYKWKGPSNLPEIGLLVVTASMAVPTVVVVRAKLQAIREANAAEERREAAAKAAQGATDVVHRDVTVTQGAAGGGMSDGG